MIEYGGKEYHSISELSEIDVVVQECEWIKGKKIRSRYAVQSFLTNMLRKKYVRYIQYKKNPDSSRKYYACNVEELIEDIRKHNLSKTEAFDVKFIGIEPMKLCEKSRAPIMLEWKETKSTKLVDMCPYIFYHRNTAQELAEGCEIFVDYCVGYFREENGEMFFYGGGYDQSFHRVPEEKIKKSFEICAILI